MIMIPSTQLDTGTVGAKEWSRVEVRYADPQQSPMARRLSLASVSLVLYMVEQQQRLAAHGYDFESLFVRHPAQAAYVFSRDLESSATVETIGGKRVGMLDIQEMLAERALALGELIHLPPDEVDAAQTWLQTVDAWRRSRPAQAEYDPFLLQTLDVAAKHHMIAQRCSTTDTAKASALSLLWDRIEEPGIGENYWRRVQPDAYQVIDDSRSIIPSTRALARAAFIRAIPERHYGHYMHIDWVRGAYANQSMTLLDPYGD